jgi:hypothetical protein
MRGGKRPRSGRPKGSPNRASGERQAAVAATGCTPLDVMLDNMRWADQEADRLLAKGLSPGAPTGSEALETIRAVLQLKERACEWARDAAPYVHPRLAAVAHRYTNADGTPIAPKVTIVIEGADRSAPKALEETGPGGSDVRH